MTLSLLPFLPFTDTLSHPSLPSPPSPVNAFRPTPSLYPSPLTIARMVTAVVTISGSVPPPASLSRRHLYLFNYHIAAATLSPLPCHPCHGRSSVITCTSS